MIPKSSGKKDMFEYFTLQKLHLFETMSFSAVLGSKHCFVNGGGTVELCLTKLNVTYPMVWNSSVTRLTLEHSPCIASRWHPSDQQSA